MSNKDASDEARIMASITERARQAVVDRAAHLARQKAKPDEVVETIKDDQNSAAIRFLRSVPPPPPVEEEPTRSVSRLFELASNRRLFLGMVIAPLIAAAFYLFGVATPLYEAKSVIAITKSSDAEAGAATGFLGSLNDSSKLQEVFRADTYIKSQALMDSLEAEMGLVTEFGGSAIDPVRRLRTLPLLSVSVHDQFDRFVESSIDVQSGLLTLYVRAPSPERAIEISEAVLRNAESQVAELGQTLFDTRQAYAAEIRAVAERQVQEAQARLVDLQFKHQEVDPRNRIENIYSRIRELEDEVQGLNSDIQKAEIDGFGDSPQIQKVVALKAHLETEIQRERSQLVSPDGASVTPLNNLLMEYEKALLEVDLARQAVRSAIEAQAEAGREAALNRSLLQVVVPPTAAQTATYPKVPGILLLCLVICLAGYAAVNGLQRSRT